MKWFSEILFLINHFSLIKNNIIPISIFYIIKNINIYSRMNKYFLI